MKRSVSIAVVVCLVALGVAGCRASEEWCKSEYGLVEPTGPAPRPDDPFGPPGPVIFFGQNQAGDMVWYEPDAGGEQQAIPGGGASDGTLRNDFVGHWINNFAVELSSGSVPNAAAIVLEREDLKLELERSPLDTAVWTVTYKNDPDDPDDDESVVLVPGSSSGTGTPLPDEFLGWQPSHFSVRSGDSTVLAKSMDYQVRFKD